MALKIHPSAGPLPPIPILGGDEAVWSANLDVPDAVGLWKHYLATGEVGALRVPEGTATATLAALSPPEMAYAYRAAAVACSPGGAEARAYVDRYAYACEQAREAHRISLKIAAEENRAVTQEEEDRIMANVPDAPTAGQLALADEWSTEVSYAVAVQGVISLSAFPDIKPMLSGRWRLYPREVLDRLPVDVVFELVGHISRASRVPPEGKA